MMPSNATDIDASSRPARRHDVVWIEVDGDVVAHDPDAGVTHVLNATAALMWRCFDGVSPLAEIATDFADALGAQPGAVLADVIAGTREMARAGLLEGTRAERKPWWPPSGSAVWPFAGGEPDEECE